VARPVEKQSVIRAIKVESFKVRQLAVNLVSGDLELITCPQSPNAIWGAHLRSDEMCPYPSIECQRVTPVSGVGAVIAAPLAEKDLTDLLNALEPPAGFAAMTLTVVSSPERRETAVRAIKKAQKTKIATNAKNAKKAKKAK
jgi:hypothetical protein